VLCGLKMTGINVTCLRVAGLFVRRVHAYDCVTLFPSNLRLRYMVQSCELMHASRKQDSLFSLLSMQRGSISDLGHHDAGN
jgi:hypothetical protein